MGSLLTAPSAEAFGRRPTTESPREERRVEFVSPEIEIISHPRADMDLFQNNQPDTQPRISVAPEQLLPPIDAEAVRKLPVVDIQKALKKAGLEPGPIDGVMGAKTKKAVRDFQKINNLAVDGIVGVKTWTLLKVFLSSPSEQVTTN